MVFLIDRHEPAEKDVYYVGTDEAYRVEALDPRDGVSITARCQSSDADKGPGVRAVTFSVSEQGVEATLGVVAAYGTQSSTDGFPSVE